MIHPECLAQVLALLQSYHDDLHHQAERAERQRHTYAHGRVLRNQAAGMGAAVALLRQSARTGSDG